MIPDKEYKFKLSCEAFREEEQYAMLCVSALAAYTDMDMAKRVIYCTFSVEPKPGCWTIKYRGYGSASKRSFTIKEYTGPLFYSFQDLMRDRYNEGYRYFTLEVNN